MSTVDLAMEASSSSGEAGGHVSYAYDEAAPGFHPTRAQQLKQVRGTSVVQLLADSLSLVLRRFKEAVRARAEYAHMRMSVEYAHLRASSSISRFMRPMQARSRSPLQGRLPHTSSIIM